MDVTMIARKWKTWKINQNIQALYLFSIGKTPLQVTIELDLPTPVVHEIQEEFWALNDLFELTLVYNEIRSIYHLLWSHFIVWKKKMLSEKHIINVLKYIGNDLPQQLTEFNVSVMT